MPFSRDADGFACVGGLRLADLLAAPEDEDGAARKPAEPPESARARIRTPAYVYDLDAIVAAAAAISRGFGAQHHLVAYAIKANSAGAILRTLAGEGCGAEVVSGGELALALACGFPAD